jgi:hypothetical protein
MNLVEVLRTSELRAKALSSRIAKDLLEDEELLENLSEEFEVLDDVEKGILMEALEYATDVDPDVVEPVLDIVVECLKCEAPKVKWEAARVIGNIVERFPDKVSRAVPILLENSRHKGTVVRWSTAYALGEIVKENEKIRSKLMPEIEKILRREKNNGVKNVYAKACKTVKGDSA